MENNIHYKFWIDKEFDGRLYDIALNEKPTKKDLIDCINFFHKDGYILDMVVNRYKYLERLYDFLVYYSNKQIFFDEEKQYPGYFYNDVICIICEAVSGLNGKINGENIIDMMCEKGFKLSINRIYMLYFECKLFQTEKDFMNRFNLDDLNLDTIEHLNLIQFYNKILLPTKFSIKTLEEFCKRKMKKPILKMILKYLKPNIFCLENACITNNQNIIKFIMESNKELKLNIICLENSIRCHNYILTKFLFPFVNEKYKEMEKKLSQNLDEIKPIEKELLQNLDEIKPIEKELLQNFDEIKPIEKKLNKKIEKK